MNRRNILAAIGALGAGGAIITGTGAFTSVEANRNVSVTVEGDANAYLSLDDTGNANSKYLNTNSTDELEIDLTGNNSTDAGGTGVNADAVTVIEDLFEVRNQGTQEVELTVTPLTFVDTDGANTLAVLAVPDGSFPTSTLSTGNAETFSLVVDEFSPTDADVSIDSEINFLAEATE
ncbi:hypothetical protein C465_07986 [Halorubrum distributum JCM 9100]|uniref:DUF1102 domain-containing protein n=2 Tax=Halorubrum distributum TaxID=29283 RepID=M0ESX6_9EURY|nr:hypothetical protein [Halorubrum distributum]ELZ49494.1 hypothetical protein C465_07986 [Halorubrum distributum JCM 9100]ELZ57271.1 hypothetical protein C466_01739 [Halorubrum distributum JCM 10118]